VRAQLRRWKFRFRNGKDRFKLAKHVADLRHQSFVAGRPSFRWPGMCKEIFRVQAHVLGLFFDEMINTFDPDALIVGGGVLETSPEFQQWFLAEIRAGMPNQREEQA